MRDVNILFLAANPTETPGLALDRELREIKQELRTCRFRDHIEFVSEWAVSPKDLQYALLSHTPDIVHFCGHGSEEGIVLLGDDAASHVVPPQGLSALFAALHCRPRLIVLNACFSLPQAEALIEHVDCAMGMSAAIEDHTARVFAGAFYRAIGFGHSIDTALRLANAAIKIAGMQGQGASMLLGEGISAEQVVLLESGPEGTGEPDLELVSARPNGGQIDLLIRNRSNDSAIIYEITATVLQNDDRSILRTMESAATYTLPISGSPGTSHTISVSHLVEGHAGERFGIMPKSTESLVSSVALRYNDGEELIFYVRLRYGNLKAVGKTREELELAAMAKRSSPA